MDRLDRYRAGDREAVWRELRELGAAVREPAHVEEATAVAEEMARRARRNVERIIEKLTSAGYEFHSNDDVRSPVVPLVDPTPEAPALLAWLEEHAGPLPLTFAAWVRIVGDVWLVGTHPQWPDSSSGDPLVLEVDGSRYANHDVRAFVLEQLDEAREADLPGMIDVAPDRLHKANISGGDPYSVLVPDRCADGLVVAETRQPFVAWLQHAFSRGGFSAAESAGGWMLPASWAPTSTRCDDVRRPPCRPSAPRSSRTATTSGSRCPTRSSSPSARASGCR